jgi:hypothetical protein
MRKRGRRKIVTEAGNRSRATKVLKKNLSNSRNNGGDKQR